MPRAANLSGITSGFDRLGQVNAMLAEQKRQKKANGGRLIGAAIGATIGAVTGLPPQAIMAAANVGGQVGGAARGAPLDPLALAQGGMGVVSAMDVAAQQTSERDLLSSITPSRAVTLQPGQVPQEGALPGLGAPLPAGAQVSPETDAYARMMDAARGSPQPLATAAQGAQLLRTVMPQKKEPKFGTAKPGDWITRDGVPTRQLPPGEAAAKGSPRQVWVNEAKGDTTPKWLAQTVDNDRQFSQLVGEYGQGNVLLQDPTKGEGGAENYGLGKTEKERAFLFVADQAIARGEIDKSQRKDFVDYLIRENLSRGETTSSGGRMAGIDSDKAIEGFKKQKPAAAAAPAGDAVVPPVAASLTAEVQNPGPAVTPAKRIPVPNRAGDKPFTPEQSTKIQTLRSGLKQYNNLIGKMLGPDGEVNEKLIAQMNIPIVGGSVPWSEGRQLRQELLDALEARIRAESGAAVPEEEIARLQERFLPSSFDSDAGVRSKLERAREFFSGTLDLVEYGRGALSEKTIAAIKANQPEGWDQIRKTIVDQQQGAGGTKRLYQKYNLEQ